MILRSIRLVQPLCTRYLTHYAVLEVPRTATKADIKKAYLEKAKECHPDLNPDNEKAAIQFQLIQEAHDVLLSSKQRAQYNHQINQERNYGGQPSNRSEEGPRRSNVRSHGVNENGRMNDDFHENHRVNQDNYQSPGAQRKYYHSERAGNLEAAFWNQTDTFIIIGLVGVGVFAFVVVRMVLSTKDELEVGRHNKTKTMAAHMAAARRAMSFGWGGIHSDVSDRAIQPLDDAHKLVWDPEKEKLVRKTQLSSQSKFDTTMQPDLVDLPGEPEPIEETKP